MQEQTHSSTSFEISASGTTAQGSPGRHPQHAIRPRLDTGPRAGDRWRSAGARYGLPIPSQTRSGWDADARDALGRAIAPVRPARLANFPRMQQVCQTPCPGRQRVGHQYRMPTASNFRTRRRALIAHRLAVRQRMDWGFTRSRIRPVCCDRL